ncbi:MAG: hypothetical protein WCE96_11405 [Nitrososphaeraceae archaeon]
MKNTKKLNMLTILTAGILMSSFMLANSNPVFAKKSHCDKNDTVCKMTAKNIKNGNSKGNKGTDGANGISITDKRRNNDSNVVEEQTLLDNSTASAPIGSGSENPFGFPM